MRRELNILICAGLLSLSGRAPVHAQAAGWVWAATGSQQSEAKALDIARDGSGSLYLAGYFTDSISIGGKKLYSAGGRDIFLAKYSQSGSVIWVKAMGGPGPDQASGIEANAAGFAMTGYFSQTAAIAGETCISKGAEDIFIASFDTAGNKRWVRTTGTLLPDEGQELCFDNQGRVLATGYFGRYAGPPHVYEKLAFGTDTLTSQGDGDVYLVKYDGAGNVLWAVNGGSVASDLSAGVAGDQAGNSYVTGVFDANLPALFDGVQINNISGGFLTNNIFLVKYDSTGTVTWGRVIGALGTISSGTSEVRAAGVTCYGSQLYLTGGFGNCDLRFHNSTVLTGMGGFDIFLARFSGDGNLEWARKAGHTGHDLAQDICTDAAGRILVTGAHYGGQFGNISLPQSGTQDVFVAAYDSTGLARWAVTGGEAGTAFANGIVTDASGAEVSIAGDFPTATTDFGSITLTNGGSANMFIAQLASPAGAGDLVREAGLSVYPNPASDLVMIRTGLEEAASVSVSDVMGRLVTSSVVVPGQPLVLHCGGWPAGVYLVLLRAQGGTKTRKLMVVR